MTSRIHSTLGFLFTSDCKQVVLIRKNKPVAQKDQLNGLGGKREKDETVLQCIVREVREETGIQTAESDWCPVGSMVWGEWVVEILTARLVEEARHLKNTGDEEVGWYEVAHLPENVLTNLPWLIPMCVDRLKNESKFEVKVSYD